ncbi:hypothetical protein XENOCAPTIV_009034 [Xenoophorus captivus]|uniref:Uncharacterized protein n=1 Tax=Xenoophorus captivus TaxID=1517983 RepID=A0ABV0QCX3_9TELE
MAELRHCRMMMVPRKGTEHMALLLSCLWEAFASGWLFEYEEKLIIVKGSLDRSHGNKNSTAEGISTPCLPNTLEKEVIFNYTMVLLQLYTTLYPTCSVVAGI